MPHLKAALLTHLARRVAAAATGTEQQLLPLVAECLGLQQSDGRPGPGAPAGVPPQQQCSLEGPLQPATTVALGSSGRRAQHDGTPQHFTLLPPSATVHLSQAHIPQTTPNTALTTQPGALPAPAPLQGPCSVPVDLQRSQSPCTSAPSLFPWGAVEGPYWHPRSSCRRHSSALWLPLARAPSSAHDPHTIRPILPLRPHTAPHIQPPHRPYSTSSSSAGEGGGGGGRESSGHVDPSLGFMRGGYSLEMVGGPRSHAETIHATQLS